MRPSSTPLYALLMLAACTSAGAPRPQGPLDEAFSLMARQRADDALAVLTRCSQDATRPERAGCLSLKGRVHFYEEEWEEAAGALEVWAELRAAQTSKGESPYLSAYNLFMAGYALEQTRSWESAARRYEQADGRWRKVQADAPARGPLHAANTLGRLRVARRLGRVVAALEETLGRQACAVSGLEALGDGRLNDDRTLDPQIPSPRLLEIARTCTDPGPRRRLLLQVIRQTKARAHEAELRRVARSMLEALPPD